MLKRFWLCFSFVICSGALLPVVAFLLPDKHSLQQRTLFRQKSAPTNVPVLVRWTNLETGRWSGNLKKDRSDVKDGSISVNALSASDDHGNGEDGGAFVVIVETMTRNKYWLEKWGGVTTNALAVALLLWCWDPSVALAVDEESSVWEKILLAVAPGLDTMVLTGAFLFALDCVRNELKAQFKADLSVLQRMLESASSRLEGELETNVTDIHEVLIRMHRKLDILISIVGERLAPNQDESQKFVERMENLWQGWKQQEDEESESDAEFE